MYIICVVKTTNLFIQCSCVICAIYVQLNIMSLVSSQAHTKAVEDVREDITKLKEDISSLKEEMANLVQALTSRVEAAGFNH